MSQSIRTYEEDELIGLLKTHQEEGFSYLYEHYSGALYGVICGVVADKEMANDVLQEVFVNIYRHIGQFDGSRSRLYTWMARIARNAAIDYLRSKGHRQSSQNHDITDAVYESAGSTQIAIDHIGLRKLVYRLEEKQREVLDLAYFSGFTQEEISDRLGIPIGTVKTRIRAALKQLRIIRQE